MDGVSFAQIEVQSLDAWLAGLREELVSKVYRPDPVRRVMIPKPNGGGERALGVPTIRDRVVQTAAKLVLEPIFEADFEDNAYGYRPARGALDAVKEVHRLVCRGYTDVVDADLSKYFNSARRPPQVGGSPRRGWCRAATDQAVAEGADRGTGRGLAPSYRAHPRLYRTEPPAVSAQSPFLGEERESDFEHVRTALGPGADIPDQGKVFCPRDRPRPCRSSWRAVF